MIKRAIQKGIAFGSHTKAAASMTLPRRSWSNINTGKKPSDMPSSSINRRAASGAAQLQTDEQMSVQELLATTQTSPQSCSGSEATTTKTNGVKQKRPQPTPPAYLGRPMTLTDLGQAIEDILQTCPPFTLNGGIKELPPHVFWSIRSLMNSYSFSDWKDYKLWVDNRYSRTLLYSTPRFDMLLLCWPPGCESPVHAHAGSECFVRVLEGEIREWTYEFPSEEELFGDDPEGYGLKMTSTHTVGPETMCYINDQVGVHKIKGTHPELGACTLHIYIPGYKRAVVFKDEQNVWKGKMISQVTFDATWDLSSTPSAARMDG